MGLPFFKDPNQNLVLLQNAWKSQLDPVLANPTNKNLILTNVSLAIGSNTINHKLGRKLQGWKIVRQRASSVIYDLQDSNQRPELTLVLQASAAVVVDIEVF